jgi:translation initiation factor IF-1
MLEPLRVQGRVLESLPNALYRVELSSEGRPQVTAHVSGQAGLLRILPGEVVEVELSAYDGTRARIVART